MRSINEHQELEIEILVVFHPEEKPEEMEEEFQTLVKPEKVIGMPEEVFSNHEKQREEFLMKFYNIKKTDYNDIAARTCKIRYL